MMTLNDTRNLKPSNIKKSISEKSHSKSPLKADILNAFFLSILQARIARDLLELRNKSVFAFVMFNALFILIVFLLQLNKDQLHVIWPLGVKTNITYVEDTGEVQPNIANCVSLHKSNGLLLTDLSWDGTPAWRFKIFHTELKS